MEYSESDENGDDVEDYSIFGDKHIGPENFNELSD